MLRVKCLIAGSILLLTNSESPKFAKYKSVESYEIRPEILIMPTYSTDGEVCQIGVEKRLYSPERVSVDPTLPRRTIEEIFDELVPSQDRGPRVQDFGDDLMIEGGQTATTNIGYKNVVLEIFSQRMPGSTKSKVIVGDIAAVIQWRHRKCK
jgi:hypothetical protein